MLEVYNQYCSSVTSYIYVCLQTVMYESQQSLHKYYQLLVVHSVTMGVSVFVLKRIATHTHTDTECTSSMAACMFLCSVH